MRLLQVSQNLSQGRGAHEVKVRGDMETKKYRAGTTDWRKKKLRGDLQRGRGSLEQAEPQHRQGEVRQRWPEERVLFTSSGGATAQLHLLRLRRPSLLSKLPQNPPAKHTTSPPSPVLCSHSSLTWMQPHLKFWVLTAAIFFLLALVFLCNVLIICQLAGLCSAMTSTAFHRADRWRTRDF